MGMVYPIPTTGWYGYHWYYQISLLHRSQMIRNDPKFGWSNTNTSNLDEVLFPSCSIQHDPYPYIYIFHPHHIQVKTCLNMGTTTDIPTYSDFKRDTSEHFWCFLLGSFKKRSDSHRFFIIFPYFCDIWFHMISHDFMLHRKPQQKQKSLRKAFRGRGENDTLIPRWGCLFSATSKTPNSDTLYQWNSYHGCVYIEYAEIFCWDIWRFPKSWGYPQSSSIYRNSIFHDKPTIFGYLDQLKGGNQNPLRQTGGCLKTQRESHIQISAYPLVMTNSSRLKIAHW